MGETKRPDISSAGLHLLAMGLMLCDHLWAMLFPAAEWLTCLGRLAYPIFAFMIVEGYRHTRDIKKYLTRLLAWAVIAEVPFDLMYGGSFFYLYHQNVLWTFLFSLLLILLIDKARARLKPLPAVLAAAGVVVLGLVLGELTMVDYFGAGVLTVLVFYFFPGRNWKSFLGQLLCLYYLNVEMMGGLFYQFAILGHEVELSQQGLALLALIPIWLYRGRQGYHSRGFRLFCYAFYPAHMLLLCLIREWMLR